METFFVGHGAECIVRVDTRVVDEKLCETVVFAVLLNGVLWNSCQSEL